MVIPIGDLNPVRRRPWVLRLIILANLAVFFGLQPWIDGQCAQLAFFLRWAAIPAELLQGTPLNPADVANGPFSAECGLSPVTDKAIYGSAVSSLFLHADIWHLLGNMLFLWIFGNNIEDRMGHGRFAGFYLLAGLLATAVFVAANSGQAVPLVGASGAVAGVLGAYLILFPTARVTVIIPPLFFLPFALPAIIVLGGWFLLQLRDVSGPAVGGGVAYLAHVAGFVFGAVAVLVLGLRTPRARRRRQPRPRPTA
ncbi:rhomboid family intramembrane serine protease [soil metagenome]